MIAYFETQGNNEEVQELIFAISEGKKKDLRVRETDGMLMQDKRMYVPNIEELKKEILDHAHISAYAMHPGGTKMYHTIRPCLLLARYEKRNCSSMLVGVQFVSRSKLKGRSHLV